ncbi:type VI secretion system Vgr family protein [Diaphorobacter aerolatus]|uniref:Type VI secretion system tip protein VgrG n=1 Tax=Diaphorobacter aerolatus TaxID=1288495 RepID=A0A7H0GGY4_9BURK|nr:type VI secretion system tip protein VgrG [Diaphorobacter aerolatus]QNP47550.1 type VI secretion system tip protein VgrG [Diaphorobacter aerolatus]
MANRTFIAHSSLGGQLEFRSLEGSEQISRLFEFRVRLISESQAIAAKSLLGKDMSIEIDLTTESAGSDKRFLSGQVTQFSYIGKDGDFNAFEAVLRPWLWHATRRSDFKIFQFKKAPDIIKEVLGKYGFSVEDRLTGTYREWPYLVQYGETDFNFVSRIMEQEGIYTFYQHQQGSHTLVLADDIGSHGPLPNGPTTISYYPGNRAAHIHDADVVDDWRFAEDIASGHFVANDYDFEKPKALLETRQQQPAGHPEDSRELYDWPGGYTDAGDGENYARVRIEQQNAQREVAQGEGNARNIAPGYLFTFSKYPRADQNKEYLIESAYYRFEENVRRSDGAGGSGAAKRAGIDSPTTYRISFSVIPKSVPYRSQRMAPKPHTTGPQTAVVTGPAGEEIYTDPYGRVKVQFHWDRYGQKDENSSCWIRVSQTWAGANYGSMHIPRIGQEVIVDFLNGDPDYPIITGRVYNALQMPPWELPGNKTQSGIKSRSSMGGAGGPGMRDGAGDANAIRFEDKKGAEQLWLHAQKDQLTEVENDEDKWVGNDRRKTVDGNETNVIHKNRTETVDQNETITIHQNRTETVDQNETITIHQNRTETVDLNEKITIHQNRTETVDLNEKITVGVNRTESVGKNEKVKIGVNQNLSVGSNKMETIGLTSIKSVGIAQMTNIGAAYNLNVGAAWMSNVGFTHMHNVGVKFSTTVGTAYSVSSGKTVNMDAGTTMVSQAGDEMSLLCGQSSITLHKNGTITMTGVKIKIAGSTVVHVDGEIVHLNK